MHRLLQFELDAGFFDLFGEAFVKSFYAYNKGWDLYVADLGLTEEQREILSRYGTVKPYQIDKSRRWISLTARVHSLCDIVKPGTIVLRSDVDGLFFESVEPIVQMMLKDDFDAIGLLLMRSLVGRARDVKRAAKLLDVPVDSPVIQDKSLAGCYLYLQGTPKVVQAFDWLRENWDEFYTYVKEEEPAIACALYKYGVKYTALKWDIFRPTSLSPGVHGYLIPSDRPFAMDHNGDYVGGIHYALGKYYMLKSSAWSNSDMFRAWQHVVLDPVKRMPWPDPEEVRCKCPIS